MDTQYPPPTPPHSTSIDHLHRQQHTHQQQHHHQQHQHHPPHHPRPPPPHSHSYSHQGGNDYPLASSPSKSSSAFHPQTDRFDPDLRDTQQSSSSSSAHRQAYAQEQLSTTAAHRAPHASSASAPAPASRHLALGSPRSDLEALSSAAVAAAAAQTSTASPSRDNHHSYPPPPPPHRYIHLNSPPSRTRTSEDPAPSSSRGESVRDFVHDPPPPLRRLSAPNVHSSRPLPSPGLQPPASASSATSSRPFLPPPSLGRRTHAPPPAIRIPTRVRDGDTFAEPQSAPLQVPNHSRAYYSHIPQPPRSAGPRPSSKPYPSPLAARNSAFLAPPYHSSSGSGASSPGVVDERALRSPHPPLTAVYPPNYPWPPLPPSSHDLGDEGHHGPPSHHYASSHHSQRPYCSSPLGDTPLTAGGNSSRAPYSSTYTPYNPTPLQTAQAHPPSPAYLSAPPPYSSGASQQQPLHKSKHAVQSSSQARTSSPLFIPPPLRFQYSTSPPPGLEMPPRKKAAVGSGGVASATPHSQSSTRSSARLMAASQASNNSRNGWTMEHTYDSVGQPKEVIVIQDSTSPIPKKRTRAVAQAEAQRWAAQQQQSGSNGHGSIANGASSSQTKKRKAEADDSAKKAKKVAPAVPQPPAPAPQHAPAAPGQAAHASWDDAEGHYIVKPDDVIGGRYKIVRLLGQGTFGKVVEARHIESRKKVAIKVIRAVQKYRDASKIEIRVLETLKKNDPTNQNKCIHLTEYFDFRNHPCLVSDLYGMSVFDFLKLNHFQPFPERHIQDFARSLLKSVKFIHDLKLVHTDLKPENILLVSNDSRLSGPRRANARSKSILRNTEIRLIDFGSATFENEYHSSVVSTRHYRAPEIILGLPWSYPCDMFSIGCILVEFFTGDALFQTHDNLEHLAMMEVVMGKMPNVMIERGRLKKPEFFKGNKIDFPNPTVSKSSRKFVKGLKSLREIIPLTNPTNALFLDLVVRLLDFDPDRRITVDEALKHPYLRANIPEPA
ncbi:protein serine/threonine kinase [Trichosporon asahii var. asahii CBS 2479]|uniref:Protein serine/threonine kinase n=1 Tax=Trichosporon asahii var. asahii (strain ATCC 90039 / CBS 2479 / JCM 2466 / KCTC 7840 / NBRC 103889/ NCYC 2677 / UAMH 7654) TaxID=1186058 RepID=J4UJD8_TRIAS|nr:protein serine/threonine kinase [Trichosporon asahii var. asahii CBS 2479]EJT51895.1 protein serine/threonine kinase [Trichosporon asahii var. asahii CBS 2479]